MMITNILKYPLMGPTYGDTPIYTGTSSPAATGATSALVTNTIDTQNTNWDTRWATTKAIKSGAPLKLRTWAYRTNYYPKGHPRACYDSIDDALLYLTPKLEGGSKYFDAQVVESNDQGLKWILEYRIPVPVKLDTVPTTPPPVSPKKITTKDRKPPVVSPVPLQTTYIPNFGTGRLNISIPLDNTYVYTLEPIYNTALLQRYGGVINYLKLFK